MGVANYDLPLLDGWLFHKGDFKRYKRLLGSSYHGTSQAGGALEHLQSFKDEKLWRDISLPHDWLTEQKIEKSQDATGYSKRRGVAWYRIKFTLPSECIESATLTFDGVLGQTTVYVNGVLAMRNFSGYNRFSCEIGDYLLSGEQNEIALFVDARRWEGWWYEGAGLYRSVYIRFREKTRLLRDNCFIRTEKNRLLADVALAGEADVELQLLDGEKVLVKEQKGAREHVVFDVAVDNPKLWSPETPCLYTCLISLIKGDRKIDEQSFQVGFRDIEWRAGAGMYLNGNRYTIQGVCCHQDHAGLGAGVTEEVEEYRILRLKSLGANAYRCAHHAPTESLLSLCDKYGLLVMVENRHFNVSDDTLKQVDDMVKLARNHPCVFLYCIFNEEPWQVEARGKRIACKLRERIKTWDDTRAVTAAQNGGSLLDENASEALDVIGMNYNLDAYEKCHERYPNKLIIGTENSPTFATRGVDKTNGKLQVFADNSYEYPTDFSQPLNHTMDCVERYPFVAGCFVWSGFAHLGEPNPYEYPSISSHWGFLDVCGFDKNIAHWLRAYYSQEPFLKIAGSWSYKAGEKIVVRVFTNVDRVELFVNGKSLGVQAVKDRRAEWETIFESGELTAVGFQNGARVEDRLITAGKFARLFVEDVTPCGAKTARILNISARDNNGRLVSDACGKVRIFAGTDGVLGVGNGNPNDCHLDKGNRVYLFNGLAQVIVKRAQKEIAFSYKNKKTQIIVKD